MKPDNKLKGREDNKNEQYLCRDCKKVIIDYSDENADFNQR